MPQALGNAALPTARSILDRALESEKGIRVNLGTPQRATSIRMQCYTARSRDRTRSTKIYEPDHPSYGQSVYDGIELFIEDSVLILRKGINIDETGLVEEL